MPAAKPMSDEELEWGRAMLDAGLGGRIIARVLLFKRGVLFRTGAERKALELSHQHVLDQLRAYMAGLVDRQNSRPSKRLDSAGNKSSRQNAAAALDGRRTEPQVPDPEETS